MKASVCGAVLVPTMHVGCSDETDPFYSEMLRVLVPTMHVGCSQNADVIALWKMKRFSTHDARGL